MSNFWNGLPSYAKGIIAIAGTGVVIFAGWKIYKTIQKKGGIKGEKGAVKEADKELQTLIKDGEKLSFPKTNYESTANTIKNLLDGCETAQTEAEVVKNIQLVVKKPVDWYYLIKIFGVRTIDNCGVLTGDTDYDLVSLLKDQLDSTVAGKDTIEYLRLYLSKIGVQI